VVVLIVHNYVCRAGLDKSANDIARIANDPSIDANQALKSVHTSPERRKALKALKKKEKKQPSLRQAVVFLFKSPQIRCLAIMALAQVCVLPSFSETLGILRNAINSILLLSIAMKYIFLNFFCVAGHLHQSHGHHLENAPPHAVPQPYGVCCLHGQHRFLHRHCYRRAHAGKPSAIQSVRLGRGGCHHSHTTTFWRSAFLLRGSLLQYFLCWNYHWSGMHPTPHISHIYQHAPTSNSLTHKDTSPPKFTLDIYGGWPTNIIKAPLVVHTYGSSLCCLCVHNLYYTLTCLSGLVCRQCYRQL
jgi:hypothetical protein